MKSKCKDKSNTQARKGSDLERVGVQKVGIPKASHGAALNALIVLRNACKHSRQDREEVGERAMRKQRKREVRMNTAQFGVKVSLVADR